MYFFEGKDWLAFKKIRLRIESEFKALLKVPTHSDPTQAPLLQAGQGDRGESEK